MRYWTWLLVFLLPLASFAAKDSKIFPYKYVKKTLPNGLTVIAVPTGFPDIVACYITVRTGSRNEVEPGKSGFAHFFEHIMFRGTEKYPSEKYDAIMKNIGADNNANTSDDRTIYHTTFSKEDLETVLMLEADRFQNLKYSEEDFKTEAKAILGEYNKNAANPIRKIIEVMRDAAFQKHTYKHTTMGFLRDIENMPNQYAYSLEFFKRYYRPEYTSIVVAGDVDPAQVFRLVEKYWGHWQHGNYTPHIPKEPPQTHPIRKHVSWPNPTLPWVVVGYKGPAFSDTQKDMPTMDIISQIAFSESSPLYRKLVIEEQKVDQLFAYFPDRKDPYIVSVFARVKKPQDMKYVESEITKTFADLTQKKVDAKRLEDVKSNLKYSFALSLDNSEAIANTLANYLALENDPEVINRLYRVYDSITVDDVLNMARKYFTPNHQIVVTLGYDENKGGAK
ncbi:MAG: insulinase family protein [Calditrichaeota bacterium]|nr:MAG: insulinase family protein [Calditrichota bacterium]